jgi:hypothetical protein
VDEITNKLLDSVIVVEVDALVIEADALVIEVDALVIEVDALAAEATLKLFCFITHHGFLGLLNTTIC